MVYEGKSLTTLQKQFYSRDVLFNNFKNISKEDIEKIKKLIEDRRNRMSSQGPKNKDQKLNNYIFTLQYLINPTIYQEIKTFDERVLYLILSVDPNLETIKTFINSEVTPISYIDEIEDEKQRQEMQSKRNAEISTYTQKVREKIGFYDSRLLKYESILHRGLLKEDNFVANVKIPLIQSIMERAERITNLNQINDFNLLRLKQIRDKWQAEAKDPKDLNSLAYNLLKRYKEIHIYTIEEQIVLFMLIADPDFDLLRIYEEESNFTKIKERALSELGFFGKGFINAEQLYHDKFEPERKISAWTK